MYMEECYEIYFFKPCISIKATPKFNNGCEVIAQIIYVIVMAQKLNYLSYYALVEDQPEDPAVLLEYSRIIETDEGRQNVRICEGSIPAIVLRAREQQDPSLYNAAEGVRARPIFLGDASVII